MKRPSSLERARAVDVLSALSALFLEFAYPSAKLAGHSRCPASNRLVVSHIGETLSKLGVGGAVAGHQRTLATSSYRSRQSASRAEIHMKDQLVLKDPREVDNLPDTLPCMAGLRKYQTVSPFQCYEEKRTGNVSQRSFQAMQKDWGKKVHRVQLREYWAGNEKQDILQCEEAVKREVTVLRALKQATRNDIKPMPFQELIGDATHSRKVKYFVRPQNYQMSSSEEDSRAEAMKWLKETHGSEPPRPNSIWLAYPWEGTWTLEFFSQPTYRRVKTVGRIALKDELRLNMKCEKWVRVANFVMKGIIRQTLQALALLHETGYAHRSLGTESIILSDQRPGGSRDSAAGLCCPDLLRIKLRGLSGSTPLDDNSETRLEAAKLWGTGDSNTLDLAALSIAEDLHAAGLCFLKVFFGALAEPEDPNSAGPAGSAQDFQRLLEKFNGDVRGKFRDYIRLKNDWRRVSILLDQPAGQEKNGWDFLETILLAREAAKKVKESGELKVLTADKLLKHPFFMVDVWHLKDKRII